MTSMCSVRSLVVAFGVLGCACSSNTSGTPPSSTTGGSPGAGGTSSQGGSTISASGGQSGTGGATGSGGVSGQGGTTVSGGATEPGTGGGNGTGGRTRRGSGEVGTGGEPGAGGAGIGGTSAGSGGSTRSASGGNGASGGATGAGTGGTTGSAAGGSPGTDPGIVKSAGCGKTRTLQNGTIAITFNNASRKYILRVPDSYDNNTAYRLVLAYAWSGASASQVVSTNYFTFATQDSKNTIFAAPDAAGGSGSWSKSDVEFTDAILAALEGDLCIDKSRVFATGFSFGGGMSIALACTRADVFRAVALFSGADLTGACPSTLTKPIAYWASQASEDANGMDRTNPMTGEAKQAMFAAVNGCTADPNSLNFPAAGQPHTCTNYKGCSAGHPTIYCIFNGAHGWEPKDPGQSTSWAAPEAWKFITQF
jgi:poly(3-hydroxybutyrate) depolymerase